MALIPSLKEIREEFELAEAELDPAAKLEALEEALALVDEILDEPSVSDADKGVASNVRKSYLRRLLVQMLAMTNVQFSEWFGYARLLLLDQQQTLAEILEGDDTLKDAFESFIALWGAKFQEALGQDIRTFVSGGKS
jgi:hypothetical protein